jgi:feruloyl-CoA synthase
MDVVVAAPNRQRIGLLVFPHIEEMRSLVGADATARAQDILESPVAREWLLALINRLNEKATGVATRIDWAAWLTEPPALDKGEITDKGSVNQRAVLTHRAEKIESLYDGTDPSRLLASQD